MTKKVLLVEDEDDLRAFVRLGLEHQGFEVIEADNGLEMISILQIQQVSAIVVDLSMPRVDGVSAVHAVKAMPRHQNTPIIVVTALADPDTIARAYEAGATELLGKPVSPDEIARVLRRCLSEDGMAELK
ncbi:MAG TPA: response regulator [Abditibacteriaceae bacterium]|jgi:CheY-like chemotaxis protein